MAAVALELLDRPPQAVPGKPVPATLPALDPDAVEFVPETDTLLTMCACAASSDQPYQG